MKAQRFLGDIFYKGSYVPHDLNRSFYWFERAAKNNDIISQFYLGMIYI